MSASKSSATKFKWDVVATAPKDYPMEISHGVFLAKGLDHGFSIPSGGTLTTGWGRVASGYGVGDEIPPLPDRVQVEFFSYAERQFYEAEFSLPYDLILEKFRQQAEDHPGKKNFSSFLLGVAPGGAISVWLKGPRTVEVYFGQARKIERSPSEGFGLPFKAKEQSDNYISEVLAESVSPAQLQKIKTEGVPIGLWSRFRNRYKWAPLFAEGKSTTDKEIYTIFLNGESFDLATNFTEADINDAKPLPSSLKFSAQVTKETDAFFVVNFDAFELMEAFEKLGKNGEKVYIEFDAQVPVTKLKIRVFNETALKDSKTPKEFIELKKFVVDP
jgi:hypothetical protein